VVPISRWLVTAVLAAGMSGCGFWFAESPRYGRARPRLVRPTAPVSEVEAGRGKLPWPVEGTVVVGFGPREDPKYGTKTRHPGISIACSRGAAVYAVSAGRVSFADQFMGMGRMVILEHGGGFHSVYAKLADIRVTVGAQVKEEQQVGVSSDTLHFELRVGGKPVNPLDWLRRK